MQFEDGLSKVFLTP